MNEIYADMRQTASELFAEFKQGEVRYIEMQAQPGATPDNPGKPRPVPTTINATARPVKTKYVDGSTVVQSDKQVSMPNDGKEPTMDGFVEIDGTPYKIIEIKRFPEAGEAISFTLIVRR